MRTGLERVIAIAVVGLVASFGIAQAQSKPIKIGQIIAMTGEAAESGKYHKQGAELAVDQINAAGGIKGRKLSVVLEDDQTTNPGAVAAFQKLLEDTEILVILPFAPPKFRPCFRPSTKPRSRAGSAGPTTA